MSTCQSAGQEPDSKSDPDEIKRATNALWDYLGPDYPGQVVKEVHHGTGMPGVGWDVGTWIDDDPCRFDLALGGFNMVRNDRPRAFLDQAVSQLIEAGKADSLTEILIGHLRILKLVCRPGSLVLFPRDMRKGVDPRKAPNSDFREAIRDRAVEVATAILSREIPATIRSGIDRTAAIEACAMLRSGPGQSAMNTLTEAMDLLTAFKNEDPSDPLLSIHKFLTRKLGVNSKAVQSYHSPFRKFVERDPDRKKFLTPGRAASMGKRALPDRYPLSYLNRVYDGWCFGETQDQAHAGPEDLGS